MQFTLDLANALTGIPEERKADFSHSSSEDSQQPPAAASVIAVSCISLDDLRNIKSRMRFTVKPGEVEVRNERGPP